VRRFDRVLVGCGNPLDSRVYECIDPSWWRLDRWFSWWFGSKGCAKGMMKFTTEDGRSRMIRIRTKYRIRKT